MIKIFATPKNLAGIFDKIQNNALNSWRAFSVKIFIIRYSKGNKGSAAEINTKYVPGVRCIPRGVLYVSNLFYKAGKIIKYPILTFIYSDIILSDNFLSVVQNTTKDFTKLLMV